MTDKERLISLITQENNAAQKAGLPYLRKGKETIEALIGEISDDTTDYMLDALTSGDLWEEYKPLTQEDKEELKKSGRIEIILWAIYFKDRQPGDPKQWEEMQTALLDIFHQEQRFYAVSQSKITNAMASLFENGLQTDLLGNATGSVGTRQQNRVDFMLKNQMKHTLRTTAKKLKDALLKEYADTHNASAAIPLKEYAELLGKDPQDKNSMDALRKQVVEDLELLKDLSAQYYERIKGRYIKSGYIELNGGTALVDHGIIRWNWNQDIIPSLEKLAPIDYSAETFLADPRTAAYDFSFYIDVNFRRNESKDTVNKIKIDTLLSKTDKIPDIDVIKQQRASAKNRIIRPFIEALDSLNRIYYDVYTIDDQRVEDPLNMNIEDFRKGYIIIDYTEYPQHPERVNKRDRKKAAKKKAEKQKKAQ